jgi:hypothetical protein
MSDVIVMDPEEMILQLRENRSPGYGWLMLAAADRLELMELEACEGRKCMARDASELIRKDAIIAELNTIARRVHAERGPSECETNGLKWNQCNSCFRSDAFDSKIEHTPDCLWLAADELLRKVGKP